MPLPRITDYEILEKLGSGSYSTVFKAKHKKNQSFHAIKCVEKSTLSKSSTDNLIREIRLLQSLNHKNIVGLNDFFWDDKNIYIVLEYCNGGNLSAFIRLRKSLPMEACKFFLRQLASGIQYMRSNDVCHFDLKPQNLLLSRYGKDVTLKIADFGFAQHLKLGEVNKELKGSLLYMAPEIVLKQRYDAKADLWSIGVILYECLFGKPPYASRTIEELLTKIVRKKEITFPPNAKMSKECRNLLIRLLQREARDRISFDEFFAHPFIDLNRVNSEKNLQKAIELATSAVECDEKKEYKEAYYLYCQSLQYFVPLIKEELDASKHQALRSRALTYFNRANEIKTVIFPANETNDSTKQSCVSEIIEPHERYKQLYALSNSSPTLKTALEIGRQAELYSMEKNLEAAFEGYKSALEILVPFINNEPKSERRQLITQQIDFWMKEAESIKSLLCTKDIDDEQKISSAHNCVIQ